jgi:hypothetical protein
MTQNTVAAKDIFNPTTDERCKRASAKPEGKVLMGQVLNV